MLVVEIFQRKKIKRFLKDSRYKATGDIQKRKRGFHPDIQDRQRHQDQDNDTLKRN